MCEDNLHIIKIFSDFMRTKSENKNVIPYTSYCFYLNKNITGNVKKKTKKNPTKHYISCTYWFYCWSGEKSHPFFNSETFTTFDATRFLWPAQRETSWNWWKVFARGWRTMASAQILQQTGSPTLGSSLAAVRPWTSQRPHWIQELQPA